MSKYLLPCKLVAFVWILFLSACGAGEKPEDIISEEERTHPTIEESRFNAQNVFNSLPDRKQVMQLIEENKIEYNPDLLNDPNNVKKYSLEFSKAINLGIYGSDLSIASSFDQTQESMVFLKCVNVLAQSLGVSGAFDTRLFERIEANSNNKDSIIEVVTEAYKKVDEILKYNNRPATSAIILSGCWIEGLYVSCKMAQVVNQEDVIKTIIDQKESLKNLVVMLEDVTLEEDAKFVLVELKKLQEAFSVAETATKYNKEAIESITRIITDLRTKATSLASA
jgi:hypothetical protein